VEALGERLVQRQAERKSLFVKLSKESVTYSRIPRIDADWVQAISSTQFI